MHVLVRDMPEASTTAHRLSGGSFLMNVIDTPRFIEDSKLYLGRHITPATMDRLLLPTLLPDVARVIYIDIDALVLADLLPLYTRDAGETGLLARPSINPRFVTVERMLEAWRHDNRDAILREVDGESIGFNAGVMVMDLDRLRERDFAQQTVDWARRFGVNDQIACAMYARSRFARLEAPWNVWVNHGHEHVQPWKILHWIGRAKPWGPRAGLQEWWAGYQVGYEELAERRLTTRAPRMRRCTY